MSDLFPMKFGHEKRIFEEISLMKQKQTPWPLVRKRTIPTGRPSVVGEI
jgi:hypothetical protein